MSPDTKTTAEDASNAGNAGNPLIGHLNTQIPDLNPSTSLSLKNQIESNLKRPVSKLSTQTPHSESAGKRQGPVPSPGKTSFVNGSFSVNIDRQNNRSSSRQKQRTAHPSTLTLIEQQKRKKPRHRKIKNLDGIKRDVDLIPSKSEESYHKSNKKSLLEKEAIALGGTENDLELIAGVPSDTEMEIQDAVLRQRPDDRLGKDVLQFVQGLEIHTKETRHSSELGNEDTKQIRNKAVLSHNSIATPDLSRLTLKSPRNQFANKNLPRLVGPHWLQCLPSSLKIKLMFLSLAL